MEPSSFPGPSLEAREDPGNEIGVKQVSFLALRSKAMMKKIRVNSVDLS